MDERKEQKDRQKERMKGKEERKKEWKKKERKSNSGRSSQFKCHKVMDLWSIKIGNFKKLDSRIQNSNQTFGFTLKS